VARDCRPGANVYRIGEFARIGSVSTKTLRFYDEIGLLKPRLTDPATRYRYYAAEQLHELAEIAALKELGLSLGEVVHLQRRGLRRPMFEQVRERLQRALARAQTSLDHLDAVLDGRGDTTPVVVKKRSAVRVASLGGMTIGYDDVALAERELLGRVPDRLRGSMRGVLWHRCADVGTPGGEPFIEVTCTRGVDRALDVKDLPAVTVACAYAADDFYAAEQAYIAIRAWMSVRRQVLAGPKRELYHDRTLEIQFPLAG
jgi:DNA-binding transcriptional MerR regulator